MPDDVALFISGKRVKQFSGFALGRAMDSVGGGVSFNAPFFPGLRAYRDLFRPAKYQKVEAFIGGNLAFIGKIDRVAPKNDGKKTSVNVQCRSLPGRIVDCTFEKADFPVQFSKAGLDEIAGVVLEKYGDIIASFPDGEGAIFEEAGPGSPSETVFDFLQNLARQRQLLMSEDERGGLVFFKPSAKSAPVATLAEGQQGVIVSDGVYDGSALYSSFDVFGQERGKTDNYARVEIPALSGEVRPKSLQANDTNAANIADVANWAASAALAAAISIPLSVEGWRRPDGELWTPNTIITLTAPSIMVYKPYSFMIKSVTLQEQQKNITSMILTIPEAYTGEIPTRFPWDE